ncbi:MAG: SAM-dependent methyltransferase [Bacteroidetes bacterium]|nr:MAG: SAM-dependent methyltransferase [Bacteroidota bacterium]
MVNDAIKLEVDITDNEFDKIYPLAIQKKSRIHWTPVKVAKIVANLLVDKAGIKVLDVGSGVGKFCIVGATLTEGIFTGIEQRKYLVDISNSLFDNYGLENARAIHANVTSIDFGFYDAFYFYNPFMENLCKSRRIDDIVTLSENHYTEYIIYVHSQLLNLPNGTKIVTYCSNGIKIPNSYKKIASYENELLDLWVKKR